ncbi:MAG: hypothetical protein JXR86_11290 [Spirochaetales bacterium]|nr:hypothetical protein [Spirochaetales bacterium]
MKKAKALKILNALMAADFLLIVITAITHDFWLERGIYGTLHALPGFLFAGMTVLHLFLNREWIKKNYMKK